MAIRANYDPKEKLASTDLNAAFGSLKGSLTGQELYQVNETPTYAGTPTGKFLTAYAYRANSLQVYLGTGVSDNEGMRRQIKGINYTESVVDHTFTFIAGPGTSLTSPDVAGTRVRVDYERGDL